MFETKSVGLALVFALISDASFDALERDEEHTRGFFARHQDKILYGSDCADLLGRQATALERLTPSCLCG